MTSSPNQLRMAHWDRSPESEIAERQLRVCELAGEIAVRIECHCVRSFRHRHVCTRCRLVSALEELADARQRTPARIA